MAPPRSLQPLLHVLVLLLVAASIGAANAQYASRSRRGLWARARKLFEFPALHRSQLTKVGFTYEIARQPAKTEEAPKDGATDPANSVASSTPPATSSSSSSSGASSSAGPSRPAGSSADGFSSGGSSSGNFGSSGNPLFPGAATSETTNGANPTPSKPNTPSQQSGTAAEAAISATVLQAAAPSAPPPPPPPPEGPCPPLPTMCDFYFQGSSSSLPVFNVSDGAGDTRLGGAIEASVRGATVDVIAANSEGADYVCQDGVNVWSAPPADSGNSSVTIIPGLPAADNSTTILGTDNQFYATQDGIQSRTFQPATGGVAPYRGKYVRVNLTSIEISVYNMVSNVNKGQNYSYFPEERRCVVFQIA
ncbi:hypothetical protein CLOM_g17329 [Closterium sp. NIES-68]|nr:hypothetical protein CLOM_g17329 [Closterium sp. NIES-68]GJP73150.1 hypothetical protein CLOP_g3889 [Closterium sp. NIES-67]